MSKLVQKDMYGEADFEANKATQEPLEDIERIKMVNKLKEKILTEIDKRLKLFINEMDSSISMEDYIFSVNESFSLYKLKLFVKSIYSFNGKKWGNYIISKKKLDIWLQDDYNFVINYLVLAEENEYNIIPMLNDSFFQYRFTSIIDMVKMEDEQK